MQPFSQWTSSRPHSALASEKKRRAKVASSAHTGGRSHAVERIPGQRTGTAPPSETQTRPARAPAKLSSTTQRLPVGQSDVVLQVRKHCAEKNAPAPPATV